MKTTRFALAMAPFLIGGCVPGADHTLVDPFPPSGDKFSGPPPVFETATSSLSATPPVTGGTLRALSDGHTAVAADPDRDRVFVVDYQANQVVAEVKLNAGDEPGRVVEDAAGRVHVALRRGGALVTLSPQTWQLVARRPVCSAPRGLAYDPSGDVVHVACAEGELVSLDAAPDGVITRRMPLDRDLRDVVVKGDRVYVSRFRAADVLVIQSGQLVSRMTPANAPGPIRVSIDQSSGGSASSGGSSVMEPAVAWRMVDDPKGDVMMLHQRALLGTVSTQQGGYGGDRCGGIVQTTVSTMHPQVAAQQASGTIANLTLAVDVAVSADGNSMAVAGPGNFRQQFGGPASQVATIDTATYVNSGSGCTFAQSPLPTPTTPAAPDAGTGATDGDAGAVASADGGAPDADGVDTGIRPYPAATPQNTVVPVASPTGEVVAVAFDKYGNLLAQTREPATLQVLTAGGRTVHLSSDTRLDTGHAIFHANSGSGLACASCHPEGGDDGRVWHFVGKDGKPESRRTQNLRGGVIATAPFHWDGTLGTLDSLMTEVFVGRMSGPPLGPDYIGTLSKWMDRIPAMPAMPVTDKSAVDRGGQVFASAGCTTCHVGSLLTDNRTQNVGTGLAAQTPSLRGVAWRAPYMHDGCARTLADRFSGPCGGGDAHGATSKLSPDQISDLVAFLETL